MIKQNVETANGYFFFRETLLICLLFKSIKNIRNLEFSLQITGNNL